MRRLATLLAGTAIGVIIGVLLTLAMVTGRALFQQHYLESASDLAGPLGMPFLVACIGGAAVGWGGWSGVGRLAAGAIAGAVLGVLGGTALAAALSDVSADRWAGGLIGAAAGALIGALALVLPWVARRRRGGRGPVMGAAIILCALVACARRPPAIGDQERIMPSRITGGSTMTGSERCRTFDIRVG